MGVCQSKPCSSWRGYCRKHAEKRRQYSLKSVRRWRKNNPDGEKKSYLRYRARNYERYLERVRSANHRRRSRRLGNGGSYTADEWTALKKFTVTAACAAASTNACSTSLAGSSFLTTSARSQRAGAMTSRTFSRSVTVEAAAITARVRSTSTTGGQHEILWKHPYPAHANPRRSHHGADWPPCLHALRQRPAVQLAGLLVRRAARLRPASRARARGPQVSRPDRFVLLVLLNLGPKWTCLDVPVPFTYRPTPFKTHDLSAKHGIFASPQLVVLHLKNLGLMQVLILR
jgi:hypothetical protein